VRVFLSVCLYVCTACARVCVYAYTRVNSACPLATDRQNRCTGGSRLNQSKLAPKAIPTQGWRVLEQVEEGRVRSTYPAMQLNSSFQCQARTRKHKSSLSALLSILRLELHDHLQIGYSLFEHVEPGDVVHRAAELAVPVAGRAAGRYEARARLGVRLVGLVRLARLRGLGLLELFALVLEVRGIRRGRRRARRRRLSARQRSRARVAHGVVTRRPDDRRRGRAGRRRRRRRRAGIARARVAGRGRADAGRCRRDSGLLVLVATAVAARHPRCYSRRRRRRRRRRCSRRCSRHRHWRHARSGHRDRGERRVEDLLGLFGAGARGAALLLVVLVVLVVIVLVVLDIVGDVELTPLEGRLELLVLRLLDPRSRCLRSREQCLEGDLEGQRGLYVGAATVDEGQGAQIAGEPVRGRLDVDDFDHGGQGAYEVVDYRAGLLGKYMARQLGEETLEKGVYRWYR
jgi:hypothetical protein